MQSKRLSCNGGFNFTLFKKNFTRFWPLWALYLVIWIFVMPIMINKEISYYNSSAEQLAGSIYECAIYGGTIMSFIFCIFNAMAVYSYMYSAKSAGFIHSLPIKREGLFVSDYLSGLGFTVLPNIVVFLISMLVVGVRGIPLTGELFAWLAIVTMLNVFFFSFATFCTNLTGHILMLPLIYGILSVAVVGAEFFTRVAFGVVAYGFDGNTTNILLEWLSPPIKLFGNSFVNGSWDEFGNLINYTFSRWKTVGIYCATGIVLSVLSLLIYRKRRTETAGDVVAVRPIKPIFKYCMAYGFAITLGLAISYIFITPEWSYGWPIVLIMLVCMLFTGFIGYFAAEMLMKKSLKVFKKGLPGYLVFVLIMVALAVCVKYDVAKIERWIPDPGEVADVNVRVYGTEDGYGDTSDAEGIEAVVRLHEELIRRKTQLQQEYADYLDEGWIENIENVYYYDVEIKYTLDSGRTVMRSYEVPVSEELLNQPDSPAALLDEAINNPAMIEARYSFEDAAGVVGGYIGSINQYYDTYELDQQDTQKLYDALLADMKAGVLGKVNFIYNESYYENILNVNIVIEQRYIENESVPEDRPDIYQIVYDEINTDCVNTIEILKSLDGLNSNALLTLYEQEYEAA